MEILPDAIFKISLYIQIYGLELLYFLALVILAGNLGKQAGEVALYRQH